MRDLHSRLRVCAAVQMAAGIGGFAFAVLFLVLNSRWDRPPVAPNLFLVVEALLTLILVTSTIIRGRWSERLTVELSQHAMPLAEHDIPEFGLLALSSAARGWPQAPIGCVWSDAALLSRAAIEDSDLQEWGIRTYDSLHDLQAAQPSAQEAVLLVTTHPPTVSDDDPEQGSLAAAITVRAIWIKPGTSVEHGLRRWANDRQIAVADNLSRLVGLADGQVTMGDSLVVLPRNRFFATTYRRAAAGIAQRTALRRARCAVALGAVGYVVAAVAAIWFLLSGGVWETTQFVLVGVFACGLGAGWAVRPLVRRVDDAYGTSLLD